MLPNYAVHEQSQFVHPNDLESNSSNVNLVRNVTDEDQNENSVTDSNVNSSHTSKLCNTFDYDSDSNNNHACTMRKMSNSKDIDDVSKVDKDNEITEDRNKSEGINSNNTSVIKITENSDLLQDKNLPQKSQYLPESSNDSNTKVGEISTSMTPDCAHATSNEADNNRNETDHVSNDDRFSHGTKKDDCQRAHETATDERESKESISNNNTTTSATPGKCDQNDEDTLKVPEIMNTEKATIGTINKAGEFSANNVNENNLLNDKIKTVLNNNLNSDREYNVNNCINNINSNNDKKSENNNQNENSYKRNSNNVIYNNDNNSNNNNDSDKNKSNEILEDDHEGNSDNDKKITCVKDEEESENKVVTSKNNVNNNNVFNVNVNNNDGASSSMHQNHVYNKSYEENIRCNDDNYVNISNNTLMKSNNNNNNTNNRYENHNNVSTINEKGNNKSSKNFNDECQNYDKIYGTNNCVRDYSAGKTVISSAATYSGNIDNERTIVNSNVNQMGRSGYKNSNDIDTNNNKNENMNNRLRSNSANDNNNMDRNVNNNYHGSQEDLKYPLKSMDIPFYNNKGSMYPLDASQKYGIIDRDSPIFYTTQQSIVASTIARMYGGANLNVSNSLPKPQNRQQVEKPDVPDVQSNSSRIVQRIREHISPMSREHERTPKIQYEPKEHQNISTSEKSRVDRPSIENFKRYSPLDSSSRETQAINLSQFSGYSTSPAHAVEESHRSNYTRTMYSPYGSSYQNHHGNYPRSSTQSNANTENQRIKEVQIEQNYTKDNNYMKNSFHSLTENISNYVTNSRIEKQTSAYSYSPDVFNENVIQQHPVETLRRSNSDIQIEYNTKSRPKQVSPARSLTQLHMKPPDFSKVQSEMIVKEKNSTKENSRSGYYNEIPRRNSKSEVSNSDIRYSESPSRNDYINSTRIQHSSSNPPQPYSSVYVKPPNFAQYEERRLIQRSNSMTEQNERIPVAPINKICCTESPRQYEHKHPQLSSDVVMSVVPSPRPQQNTTHGHSFRYPSTPSDSRRMMAEATNTNVKDINHDKRNVNTIYVDQMDHMRNVNQYDGCCIKEPVSSQKPMQPSIVQQTNDSRYSRQFASEPPSPKASDNKFYRSPSNEVIYTRNVETSPYQKSAQMHSTTPPIPTKLVHQREFTMPLTSENENALHKQRSNKQVFLSRRNEDSRDNWPHQPPPQPMRRHSNASSPYDAYQMGYNNLPPSPYSNQPSPTNMQPILKQSPSPIQTIPMATSPADHHQNRPSPCSNINYNCTMSTPPTQELYQGPLKSGSIIREPEKSCTTPVHTSDRRLKNEMNQIPSVYPAAAATTVSYKKVETTSLPPSKRYNPNTQVNSSLENINRGHSRTVKSEHKQEKRPNYRDMLNHAIRNPSSEADLNYQIIKRTLNKEIPIPNTDTDLRKNIFDFPATGSHTTSKKSKTEDVNYYNSKKDRGWNSDLQVRRTSVEYKQNEWKPEIKGQETKSNRSTYHTNRDFAKNDISITITKVPESPVDVVRSGYTKKETKTNQIFPPVFTKQEAILNDVKIEPAPPKMSPILPGNRINSLNSPIDATIRRESPLDLSVKTVKTKADSTGVAESFHYRNSKSRTPLPKFEFSPNFSRHAEKLPPEDRTSNFFTRASTLPPDCEITPSKQPSFYRQSSHESLVREYQSPDSYQSDPLRGKIHSNHITFNHSSNPERKQTYPTPERHVEIKPLRPSTERSHSLSDISYKGIERVGETRMINTTIRHTSQHNDTQIYEMTRDDRSLPSTSIQRAAYNKIVDLAAEVPFRPNDPNTSCLSLIKSNDKQIIDIRIPATSPIYAPRHLPPKDINCVACVQCVDCDKAETKCKPVNSMPCQSECCTRQYNAYPCEPITCKDKDVSFKTTVKDDGNRYYPHVKDKPHYQREYPPKIGLLKGKYIYDEASVSLKANDAIYSVKSTALPYEKQVYNQNVAQVLVKQEPIEKKCTTSVLLSTKEPCPPDYKPLIHKNSHLVNDNLCFKNIPTSNGPVLIHDTKVEKSHYESIVRPVHHSKAEEPEHFPFNQSSLQSVVGQKEIYVPHIDTEHKIKESRLHAAAATPPRGIGQDVISKLKNSIEQRGLEKQRNMALMEMKNESQKDKEKSSASDIASIIAARIRTKGELKGYLPLPEATTPLKTPPLKEELKDDPVQQLPMVESFVETEEVKNFDLCNWTSTCDDFVEQLQTGAKKRRGKKRPNDKSSQADNDVLEKRSNHSGHQPFDIYSSDSRTGNYRSYMYSSSEDDKPLLLLKQASISGSTYENDSATSKDVSSSKHLSFENKDDFERKIESNMLFAKKPTESEKSNNSFGEDKQKRIPPSRSETTDVDSDNDNTRNHLRRRKFTKRQRQRPVNAQHAYDFSDSDSCSGLNDRISVNSVVVSAFQQRKRFLMKTSSESDTSKPKRKIIRTSIDLDLTNTSSIKTEIVSDNDKSKPSIILEESLKKETENEQVSENKCSNLLSNVHPSSDGEQQQPLFLSKTNDKTNKLSKDIKRNLQSYDNFEDQKMTRSKHKKEIEKSLAHSKILRNDKIIQDPFYEKGRALSNIERSGKKTVKDVIKQKNKIYKENDSKNIKDPLDNEKKNAVKCNEDQKKELASSDSMSDREQYSLRTRLRSRDSKLPIEKTPQLESSQKSSNMKNDVRNKEDGKDKLLESIKRGKVPKVVLTRKDKCLAKNFVPTKTASTLKKDTELKTFPPGWEMEVYQYKRSLKIPARLITIKGPVHNRVSTSLPDLDSHSGVDSDICSETNKKCAKPKDVDIQSSEVNHRKSKKVAKVSCTQQETTKDVKPSVELNQEFPKESTKSIIDVLHQRALRQNKFIKKSKQSTASNTPKTPLHPLSRETEMLQTPDTGRNETQSSGVINVFDTEILTSRTRTESRIMKNKELIREVFGGDERPASAPPGIQTDIKTEQVTFDEKYEEYMQKMNVDFGEKIRKNRKLGILTNENSIMDNVTIKQEKIDDESESTIASKTEKNEFSCSTTPVKDIQFNAEIGICEDINVENKDSIKKILFKKKNKYRTSRRKGSSGFDYIRKKKKPIQHSYNALAIRKRKKALSIDLFPARNEGDICKEIQKWVLNKSVGQSALHKAARLGYLDVIAYCLERIGMNPDLKDNAGYTPLHEACSKGRIDIARLLLQYGANHSESAASGIRPLHDASESGSVEIVRLLLSYGADPLLTTYSGQTPLMLAETNEMEHFFKKHLEDVQSCGPFKQPWRFEGAWRIYDPHVSGFDSLVGASNEKDYTLVGWSENMNVKHQFENTIEQQQNFDNNSRRRLDTRMKDETILTTRSDHDRECLALDDKSDRNDKITNEKMQISMKCSVMLNNIGPISCLKKFENNIEMKNYLEYGESNRTNVNNMSDMEDNLFEFEEADIPLPPVYLLNDEGKEKWILLNDLCNLLKVKSKDTLLKQICPSMPPSTVNKQLLRELKMSDFLEKATCLQLLCAGEKLNIRSSKVVLVKYNDKVKSLLGVKSILMQF